MTDTVVTIIGGGVHGTHLAIRLLDAGIDRKRLRIVEPDGLLATFRRQCQQCGMAELRSPFVHHIGTDPFSLRAFARQRGRTDELVAAETGGDRPTVSLFFDHAEWVCRQHDLESLVDSTRATAIREGDSHITVETPNGRHTARWCLLAVGHRRVNRPAWAAKLPSTAPVDHVWDQGFDPGEIGSTATVGIVGGGITAAKCATTLAQSGREVRLFVRSPFRVELREADTDWMHFSRVIDRLHQLPSASRAREERIAEARYGGAMPPHVFRRLRRAIDDGRVGLNRTEITAVSDAGGTVVVNCGDGTARCLDQVVCATGFGSPYEGPLFEQLRTETELAVGYRDAPVLDDGTLRWRREDGTLSRVAVSGAAAQQVLGPFSRNIIGARRAGDCLVEVVDADTDSASAHSIS
jgi:glycine/D-amino acid oxidase-like deaminating enzyme